MEHEVQEISAAEVRFADIFVIIDELINCFSKVIDGGQLPLTPGPLGIVRVSALIRGYNLLKSIRQLLANDHWENATILMRSLFELVLNIEEVERNPIIADAQAERFCRFEVLQKFRRIKANSNYELSSRGHAHNPKLTALEKELPKFFGEWIEKRRTDGTIKWKTSALSRL